MFQKRNKKKKVKGSYLVKRGVKIEIRPTWAFQILPPEGTSYSLKFAEENCFREENPSRSASVTFSWVITRRFSTFLRHSSFVLRFLRSSIGKYPKPSFSIHSMYPWWSPFVWCTFILVFIYFLYPLLTCFSHLFKLSLA